MKINIRLLIIMFFGTCFLGYALENDTIKDYKFTEVIKIPHTPVKNQYRSGTCWCFSGVSFLESEMIRKGKPEVDLSEMYIVYHTYLEKAIKYVRMHGHINFAAGGAFHDVTQMILKYGIVPESVYSGLHYGENKHTHGEINMILKNYVDGIVKNKNKKLSPVWIDGYMAILDTYFGKLPEKFEYEGRTYTPKSFASEYCGINTGDYVEISSFTHHPYYGKFVLEVPDNWMYDEMYNLPIDEMMEVIETALEEGSSVAWGADISEKGFDSKKSGVAVVPDIENVEMADSEMSRWEKLSESEKKLKLIKTPGNEKEINQEMRQIAFDNYETTDDHGMHIIGVANDQLGNPYFIVKNSWGEYNKYDGFFYASKPFVTYKTMSIMVPKEVIPKLIKKKLNIQ